MIVAKTGTAFQDAAASLDTLGAAGWVIGGTVVIFVVLLLGIRWVLMRT